MPERKLLQLQIKGVANGPSKTLGLAKIIFVEFRRSRSLVFSAVMCISQSRFLYEGVSESRFFARLRVSKSRFVCLFFFLMTSSCHLILNFIKATFNLPSWANNPR